VGSLANSDVEATNRMRAAVAGKRDRQETCKDMGNSSCTPAGTPLQQ